MKCCELGEFTQKIRNRACQSVGANIQLYKILLRSSLGELFDYIPLSLNFSFVNTESRPTDDGVGPDKTLSARPISVSATSNARSAGIVPRMDCEGSTNASTSESASHMAPDQLHSFDGTAPTESK